MTYGKLDNIYDEINIHSKLYHQNIIKLYNVYEDEETINIIMEYAKEGNLYHLIKKEKNGFSEQKSYEFFIQIINAVYYLHSNNIIHRDIKPENILIGDDNKLKLCDFGWAKELTLENRSTFCGTMEYMAPEIVGSENYDYSVDIWSLGILLYELLFGHSPFNADSNKNIIFNIKKHELNYDNENKKISNSCKDLIERLLNENPQKRLRIKDILEHPFIKKYSKKALLYTKKSSTIINEDKINNQLSKNLNDVNNNNIHINKRDELNNMKVNSRLKRSNTININGNNDSKFGLKYFSSKEMLFNDIKEIEEQKAIKNNHKSNKQLALLAKFRYSLNIQLEKAKKSIENISFKSNQNFTFEDIRDNQFQKDMERQKKEKRYKKYKSSKNNVYNFDYLKFEESKTKYENNDKKSVSNKNIIFENDYEDIINGEEEKAALERLNRAYSKFEKKNLGIIKE